MIDCFVVETPRNDNGRIAKNARKELEAKTGKKVITAENYKLSRSDNRQIES